jgi:L-malate glycosyltransferase
MYTVLFPVNELQIGGAQQQLLELVRHLDKTRFHPMVAPLIAGGSLDREFRSVPGVEVVDLDRRGKLDFSTLWKMAALLRTRRVDVVQPFVMPSIFFGLLPAFCVGTPVTVATQRSGARRFVRGAAQLYEVAENVLSRFADVVVANSVAGQELLLERGTPAEKTMVICNGVNPERLRVDHARASAHRQRLCGPDGTHVVGILATLTPAKDHATFLRACAQASADLPGLRLAIIGDGPLRPELEQMAAELGIADRTIFFGHQRDVADLLAACDLLVSSSKDYEGHSNSILEAMALRVPVVATDIGGNRELVKADGTGYLVPVADAGALAAAIRHAFATPDETEALADRARQMIEQQFSVERMADDYEALYERLLHAKAGRATREARRASTSLRPEGLRTRSR